MCSGDYISNIGLCSSLATYNSNCFICQQALDRPIIIVLRYLINAVKLMKATADRIDDPDNVETKLGPLADHAQLARVELFFTGNKTQILSDRW